MALSMRLLDKTQVFKFLVTHRDTKVMWYLHQAARVVENAYQNDNSDGASNGEYRVLDALAPLGLEVIFDVGANMGDWTARALEANPRAHVHAFEIEPSMRSRLAERFAGERRVSVPACGLGDCKGDIEIAVDRVDPCITSTKLAGAAAHCDVIQAFVSTADEYARENGVDRIDFLKVDVEGADMDVLRGCQSLLTQGRVRLVQFEFTNWAPAARVFLADFYSFFEPLGYRLGRRYPHHVEWRSYDVGHEIFVRANFLATRERGIIEAL